MGVQREAALKNQQDFHNHGTDHDLYINQLQTRQFTDQIKSANQRVGLTRNVFGSRINPNIKTLASTTEPKDNLVPLNQVVSNNRVLTANDGANNNDDLSENGLNQEPKLTAKTLSPLIAVKETEANERTMEDDAKFKNSLEDQSTLQLSPDKNGQDIVKMSEPGREELPLSNGNRTTDLNESDDPENEPKGEGDLNEDTESEKATTAAEKPGEKGNANDEPADSINEQLGDGKSTVEEKKESTTISPLITTKIATTQTQTTLSSTSTSENGNYNDDKEIKTTTRKMIANPQSEQIDANDQMEPISPNSKKSAGAQVAEVIDKLVASRRGQAPPHIVVVAPFRLKNGNQKLTVTEGNIHGIPPFGSRSISAQNLAGFLNKGSKLRPSGERSTGHMIKIISTVKATESTTPSTTTTKQVKASPSLEDVDEEEKDEKEDEESKTDDNDDKTESEKKETKKEPKPIDNEKLTKENKETDDSKSDDEEEEDDDSPSTTAKSVLINRVKEAVRNQIRKNKQWESKKENPKKNEKPNEKLLNPTASNKHKDREEPNSRVRQITSPRKSVEDLIKINHDDSKNISASIDDSIRRIDDESPEKLISLDLTPDEDVFLKGGFLKKTNSLEKAFKELEKSKNLKYHEHEYSHQTKQQESYYGSSSNNRKQTIKPTIDLQQIIKPSSSPPPQPQINQHFFVNTHNSNGNNNDSSPPPNNRKNKNQTNLHKQQMNNRPKLAKFTNQDHRPLESNSFNNGPKVFRKSHPPAPASYSYQQKMTIRKNRPIINSHPVHNFAVQQNQQQKQILNQLLQANSASNNQIQRSMNVNSGGSNINQLNHKMTSNQRSVHIPKQQLIQHIQMLSNLNSKHTFPNVQNSQIMLNQIPTQQTPNNIPIIPTPSISPEQFVDLNQMMNSGKLTSDALALYQEQNLRNLQAGLQGMESAQNSFIDANNHINVQPSKPQIHYADQPGQFADASNINPTNQPPNTNNLQAAESIGHSQHSPSSNVLSVGDSSNSAMMNFNLKEPPHADKGLHMSFGGGPTGGGSQLITNPLGIFKSIFLPLLPKPRMNLNGKVVFGVVLDTSLRKPAPKIHAPVIVVPPSKPHHFFG